MYRNGLHVGQNNVVATLNIPQFLHPISDVSLKRPIGIVDLYLIFTLALTTFLKKNKSLNWSVECKLVFFGLKKILTATPKK